MSHSRRSPSQIQHNIAREYNIPAKDIFGVIYQRKSTYMAARAYVRALHEEYPEKSERWLARTSHRQALTVRKLLRDPVPDYLEDRRMVNSWGDRDSDRLRDLVNNGLSGEAICRAFDIPYPEGRSIVYFEISRQIENKTLRRGRLGFPRKPVE